jgi:hypothetical protein
LKSNSLSEVGIMQSGTHHFAWFGEEMILQLHGIGPWTVTFVNPADAPEGLDQTVIRLLII